MERTIPVIYETEHFSVKVPHLPHITRNEGGHIFVEVNDHSIEDRWELPIEQINEMAWLCAVAGRAFKEVMIEAGIPIYRLNIQDNGNWSFVRGERPVLHVHIYGRSECEKRYDTAQSYGNSLFFPYSGTGFFNAFEPLTDDDIVKIAQRMEEIGKEEQFAGAAPKCVYSASRDGIKKQDA